MKDVIEASNLPLDEKVYLKKDWLGYRVVEPPKTWIDWVFGSKRQRVILLVIIIISLMLYFGIQELIGAYKEIAANPCNYCVPNSLNLSLLP